MSERRVAVYTGSFDPITNGHIDLIDRAAHLFDEVIVTLATNMAKQPLFDTEERLALIRGAVGDRPNVRIDVNEGLLTVDYAREKGAQIVIRGLRALTDFEFEFEMAMMNDHLYPDVETVFLMTSAKWFYVSSSRLREIVSFGGDVSAFVPKAVEQQLRAKLAPARRPGKTR
jgi:pantetheine-phosphate adenylyltransferase